mmetsp:Transcript_57666/g.185291  ORF Transcript_57666/g.185291 Transcript_57666/m.185291 type:complete len:231 (-) Transcript_57666:260-952(-)
MSNSNFQWLSKVFTTRILSGFRVTPQRPGTVPGRRKATGMTSSRSCRSWPRRGCRALLMCSSMSSRLSVGEVSRKSRRAFASSRPTFCTRGSPIRRTTPSTELRCCSVNRKESSCRAVFGERCTSMRLMFPKPAPAIARTRCRSASPNVPRPADISWSVATSASSGLSSNMRAETRVGATAAGCWAAGRRTELDPGGGVVTTLYPAQPVRATRTKAARLARSPPGAHRTC